MRPEDEERGGQAHLPDHEVIKDEFLIRLRGFQDNNQSEDPLLVRKADLPRRLNNSLDSKIASLDR